MELSAKCLAEATSYPFRVMETLVLIEASLEAGRAERSWAEVVASPLQQMVFGPLLGWIRSAPFATVPSTPFLAWGKHGASLLVQTWIPLLTTGLVSALVSEVSDHFTARLILRAEEEEDEEEDAEEVFDEEAGVTGERQRSRSQASH
jgi:hypothetical protein